MFLSLATGPSLKTLLTSAPRTRPTVCRQTLKVARHRLQHFYACVMRLRANDTGSRVTQLLPDGKVASHRSISVTGALGRRVREIISATFSAAVPVSVDLSTLGRMVFAQQATRRF